VVSSACFPSFIDFSASAAAPGDDLAHHAQGNFLRACGSQVEACRRVGI
jgi:hypothetical protein